MTQCRVYNFKRLVSGNGPPPPDAPREWSTATSALRTRLPSLQSAKSHASGGSDVDRSVQVVMVALKGAARKRSGLVPRSASRPAGGGEGTEIQRSLALMHLI
jgi:hypothetical protein